MKFWIGLLLLAITMSACQQDIDLYEGSSSLYFDENSAGMYEVHWGVLNSDIKKVNVRLRVNLMGQVTDYPRKFSIKVVSNETDSLHSVAGVDYTPFPLEYELPAMEEHLYIDIEVLRTDTLKKQARRFSVELVPNDELGKDFREYDESSDGTLVALNDYCIIYMDEEFPRPWWWQGDREDIFGEWSAKKGEVICDIGKIDRVKFQGEIDGIGDHISEEFLRFVGRKVQMWLDEKEEEGDPVMDEDGEPMIMGEDSWDY